MFIWILFQTPPRARLTSSGRLDSTRRGSVWNARAGGPWELMLLLSASLPAQWLVRVCQVHCQSRRRLIFSFQVQPESSQSLSPRAAALLICTRAGVLHLLSRGLLGLITLKTLVAACFQYIHQMSAPLVRLLFSLLPPTSVPLVSPPFPSPDTSLCFLIVFWYNSLHVCLLPHLQLNVSSILWP